MMLTFLFFEADFPPIYNFLLPRKEASPFSAGKLPVGGSNLLSLP